jgi:hypothetical protein
MSKTTMNDNVNGADADAADDAANADTAVTVMWEAPFNRTSAILFCVVVEITLCKAVRNVGAREHRGDRHCKDILIHNVSRKGRMPTHDHSRFRV